MHYLKYTKDNQGFVDAVSRSEELEIMHTELNSVYEYHVGGSLPLDAPTYVIRKADDDLYRGVKAGQFCYVLNSRQMGKSSLRVRIMQRLQAEGMACAVVDLTAIGNQNIRPDQWYAGIIYTLASSFNLLDKLDFETWWYNLVDLSPVHRLTEFIQNFLLTNNHLNFAIFIDEIDSVMALKFPVNDFLELIFSCYNNRTKQPEYKRLTWILLGVASPYDLIGSPNYITPFNIGDAIELNGFQLHEVQPLVRGLSETIAHPDSVIQEVLQWTRGQPFLTQKLCHLVLHESRLLGVNTRSSLQESGEFLNNSKSKIAEWMEKLVRSHLIENWEAQDEPEHLRTIRNRILNSGRRTIKLLELYQQILQQGEIVANDTPEQMELRLSGLVVKQDSKLKVGNPIYQAVFNLAWVQQTLSNLPPYCIR